MNIFTKFRRNTFSLEDGLRVWDDKECLYNFLKFTDRVHIASELVQDKHGFITHQILQVQCGDQLFQSFPLQLDWPLEPVVFPEEHKAKLN